MTPARGRLARRPQRPALREERLTGTALEISLREPLDDLCFRKERTWTHELLSTLSNQWAPPSSVNLRHATATRKLVKEGREQGGRGSVQENHPRHQAKQEKHHGPSGCHRHPYSNPPTCSHFQREPTLRCKDVRERTAGHKACTDLRISRREEEDLVLGDATKAPARSIITTRTTTAKAKVAVMAEAAAIGGFIPDQGGEECAKNGCFTETLEREPGGYKDTLLQDFVGWGG